MILSGCQCGQHRGRVHVFDATRARRKQKQTWQRVRNAEIKFGQQLRGVADQVGKLVNGLFGGAEDPAAETVLQNALRQYSKMLEPWAAAVSTRMLADVSQRDEAMWATLAKEMGLSLRAEIAKAPTGEFLKDMLAESVALITSLPTEAGQRVHELTLKSLETGSRAEALADEIMRTGEVTRARARLIARTEVSRTASGLIEARSAHVGSDAYYWRSSEDADVRNTDGNPVGSHRRLNGKVIKWSEPPVASTNGQRYHAGQGPNCRCWPEPIFDMAA